MLVHVWIPKADQLWKYNLAATEGISSFSGIMNMPCISKAAYYKQVEKIIEAQEDETQQEIKNAGQRL